MPKWTYVTRFRPVPPSIGRMAQVSAAAAGCIAGLTRDALLIAMLATYVAAALIGGLRAWYREHQIERGGLRIMAPINEDVQPQSDEQDW